MNWKPNNIKENFRKMMSAKNSSRSMDDITLDLKNELRSIKEESLLVHAMRLLLELDFRGTSELYTHLESPMKQTLFLIDLYYSLDARTGKYEIDQTNWDRIAQLLDELEMSYFIMVGFPNDNDVFHDERDDMVAVSLSSFLTYFENARLCYDEQTFDRLTRYCTKYNDIIKTNFGFEVCDAIKFVLHVRDLNNKKYSDTVHSGGDTLAYYYKHPDEWRMLTMEFVKRGLVNPREWWTQPELSGLLKMMQNNPGEVNLHGTDELYDVGMPHNVVDRIIEFFRYDKEANVNTEVYYADKRYFEDHPLIVSNSKCVCPHSKFFIEALYNRLNAYLQCDPKLGVKYKQFKDKSFEQKVGELFRDFFPTGTKIFTNYSIDGHTENDLLVVFADTCIVVEMKNCGFRAPSRDPIAAYTKISRDYSGAIQLGYDQCKRVEQILLSGNNVEVKDAKTGKLLYHLQPKKIQEVWSIVVTDFKYGAIQTDLSSLLKKEEDVLFPWSVCVDDLESLFLLMRKILKGIAPARFLEFLNHREQFQGHLLCFDELECCGWYLCNREQFKEYACKDTMVNTAPPMADIFDAHYRTGLGFKNELDADIKRYYSLSDYPRVFDMTEISGKEIL